MNRDAWYCYFASNAECPYPELGSATLSLPNELRCALARSLEMFRVGETGEGRIVNDVRRERGLWNESLCESLRLYIAEEGQHARVLGEIVRACAQGGPIQFRSGGVRHWIGTKGFVVARRVAGVNTKMLVLFAAEVVGFLFYSLVAERLEPCAVRTALERIAADEGAHLLFQRDYFEALARSNKWSFVDDRVRHSGWRAAVTTATALALTVFAANHRDTLALLGMDAKSLTMRGWGTLQRVLQAPDGPPLSSPSFLKNSFTS